jgi:hypothetical protein
LRQAIEFRLALVSKLALAMMKAETQRRYGPAPLLQNLALGREVQSDPFVPGRIVVGVPQANQRPGRTRRRTSSSCRTGPSDLDDESDRRPRLTAELRAHLKREVDRARREQLERDRLAGHMLFRGDPGRVGR